MSEPIKTAGTIDMTPTWSALLPMFVAALQHGSDEGRKIAREELQRMAQAADHWNAHCTAQGVSE